MKNDNFFWIQRYIKCTYKCKLIIQFTNFHYKYSGMDHSSSSFYSILIQPLKLAPKILINDITVMRNHGSFSNTSEPSLDEIHCDWDKGFCENWSSSFLMENLRWFEVIWCSGRVLTWYFVVMSWRKSQKTVSD